VTALLAWVHYGACVTETAESDPVSGFAALMAQARPVPEPKDEDPAPYGYTTDERTGITRPKKTPGRPRKSPSLEDLKAARAADPAPAEPGPPGDRPPAPLKGRAGRRQRSRAVDPKPAPPIPQKYRAEGSIAKGVNQLYRKAGKLVRVMDGDIGQALIDITRAEDDDDVTVGDAWEALARSNPRVRAFLLRLLAGGAWSGVFAVHMPVLMALLMKDSIRKRIPFGGLLMAVADDSEDSPAPGEGTVFDGLKPDDMAQMMAMAQAMAGRVTGNGVPDRGQPGG
jgi:hypothetical protein